MTCLVDGLPAHAAGRVATAAAAAVLVTFPVVVALTVTVTVAAPAIVVAPRRRAVLTHSLMSGGAPAGCEMDELTSGWRS
jgi:hypothetical protein